MTQTNSLINCPGHIALSARPLVNYGSTEQLPTSPPSGAIGGGLSGTASAAASVGGAVVPGGFGGAASTRSAGGGSLRPLPAPEPNTLRLNLSPIGTGIYPTRIMLTSALDVRVIDVELTAQTMTQTFMLEFNTTARQPIAQVGRGKEGQGGV